MKSLPDFLKGMTFPTSQSTKSGVTTTITDVTSHVTKNLERLKLNHLIAIGGDDTLSYAAKLDKLGVKVIAIPKTMDNDVRNTEYCIGFSTAITRAMDAIEASAPRWDRMSALACSACSAVMPAIPRSTRPMSRQSAARFPNISLNSTS